MYKHSLPQFTTKNCPYILTDRLKYSIRVPLRFIARSLGSPAPGQVAVALPGTGSAEGGSVAVALARSSATDTTREAVAEAGRRRAVVAAAVGRKDEIVETWGIPSRTVPAKGHHCTLAARRTAGAASMQSAPAWAAAEERKRKVPRKKGDC